MKYLPATLFLLLVHQGASAQGPEHFIGTFAGTEDVEITCSNAAWNKSESRSWKVTHSDLDGNTYQGLIESNGEYEAEGTISGNSATGTFEGQDSMGNPCHGEFRNTLDGDELKAEASGTCPTVSCDFESEITATRQ